MNHMRGEARRGNANRQAVVSGTFGGDNELICPQPYIFFASGAPRSGVERGLKPSLYSLSECVDRYGVVTGASGAATSRPAR